MTRFTKVQKKSYLEASEFKSIPLKSKSSHNKTNEKELQRRRDRRSKLKEKNMTCFLCRKTGHSIKTCRKAKSDEGDICYRCGSREHILSKCTETIDKSNPLPYAKCFYCKQSGHLASECTQNENGLYPNGGSCKFCGSVRHLATQCKPSQQEVGVTQLGTIDLEQGADDDDVFLALRNMNQDKSAPKPVKKSKNVVSF